MLGQACRSQNLKLYDPLYCWYTRGRIPIDRYGAEINQTCPHHRKLWNGLVANTLLTGITLQQFSTCSTSHYHSQVAIARQRSEFASQTSFWVSLAASNHDFLQNHEIRSIVTNSVGV